ncbi:hypothetical protein MASR1M12_30840 [Erysipelotrichia bacterium]
MGIEKPSGMCFVEHTLYRALTQRVFNGKIYHLRVFPFKLTSTDDKITPNAGLGLFGEFLYSQGIAALLDANVNGFKSNHSYKPSELLFRCF